MVKIYRLFILFVILSSFSISQLAIAKTHSHKKKYFKTHKKTAKIHSKRKAKPAATSIYKAKRSGYSAIGIASFYGGGFHGRKMANGEVFDSHDPNIAAHRFLPLGTKLSVTNLSNGRTIYVEVQDRMGHSTRVIDLSQAAAKHLGMHRKGLTKVRIVKISNAEFNEKKHHLEVNEDDSGHPH